MELNKAIDRILKTYDLNTERSRREIQEWSKCIQGKSGASYFLSIMADVYEGGDRPSATWVIETGL
mgnify:FL=1